MSKIVYANVTGLIAPNVYTDKGDEWLADHPLVKAKPELFDVPEEHEEPIPVSVEEPKKAVKRGRPKGGAK